MTEPDSGSQHMKALEYANQVRRERAKIKRDIKTGEVTVGELLENTPASILTMNVHDLVMAIPKFGRGKANRVLTFCRISPAKQVGSLSDRQRGELMWAIRRNQPKTNR